MTPVVFYISGHGFGHASRDIEIVNALIAQEPDLPIVIRTTAPKRLFDLTVRPSPHAASARPRARPNVEVQHVVTDTGVAQRDSLHVDEAGTVAALRAFMRELPSRIAEEAAFLRQTQAALVVADLPPLGIAAAHAAGIPAVALGNFTWDWIYSAYAEAADLVTRVRDARLTARVAMRLPMHGGFDGFSEIIDLPFVARRSIHDPLETRRALGLPTDERLVLVSFGGLGLDGLDVDALSQLEGYAAVVSGREPLAALPPGLSHGRRGSLLPFDEPTMYAAGYRYEDLVRAVDVVVSKPGYGIIAECLANDTALLYTSRGHFIEYDVLVDAMPRFLRAAFMGHADLFAGQWSPHLDALLAQAPPRERPAVTGAEIASDILLKMME